MPEPQVEITSFPLEVKCKKQPRYKGLRRPRVHCEDCLMIWRMNGSPGEGVAPRLTRKRLQEFWDRLYGLVDEWLDEADSCDSYDSCCGAREAEAYRECAKQLEALLAEMEGGQNADA